MPTLKELQDLYSKNNLGQFTLYKDNDGNTFLKIPDPEGGVGYVFKNPDISGLDQTKINNAGALNWTGAGGISGTHADESWQRALGRAEGKSIDSIASNLIERTNSKIQSDIRSKASDEVNKIIDQYRGGRGNYDFDPELLKRAGLSPDTTIRDGKYTNIKDYEASVKLKNDPNQVNIGTPERPLYVPKGSAAEAQQKGTSQEDYLKSKEGQDYLAKNPDITPVTPTEPTPQTTGTVSAAGAGQTEMEYINDKGQKIFPKQMAKFNTDAEYDQWARSQGFTPVSESATQGTGSPTTTPATQTGTTGQKQFYRVGKDIFDASTNQRITEPDWKQNWSGKAQEVKSPTNQATPQGEDKNMYLGGSKTFDEAAGGMPQAMIDKFYSAYKKMPTMQDMQQYRTSPQTFEKMLDDAFNEEQKTRQEEQTQKQTEEEKVKTEEEKANTDAAIKIIDDAITRGEIPPEIGDLWKSVVGNYQGTSFDQQEILDAFNKTKAEVIDPYMKELTDVAIKDFQAAFQTMEGSREREVEQERSMAGENIRQAQAGLEKSGMTFTGQGVEQLGGQSAYAQEAGANVATPTQTSFGGMFYEGKTNQANRLIASSSMANYNTSLQRLGRSAEDYLGTEKAAGLGIPYSLGGVSQTGQLAKERASREASALQDYINQWSAKQDLLTNKTLT